MLWRRRDKKEEAVQGSALSAKSEKKLVKRAMGLVMAGRHDEAKRICDSVLGANPRSAGAMEAMAAMAMGSDDPKRAVQWYDRALEADPGNVDYLVAKAAVLSIRRKHRAAAKCCDEALRLDPGNDLAASEKGVALKNMGRFDEALQCYRASLSPCG